MLHIMHMQHIPTHAQALVALRFGRPTEEILRELYVTDRRSVVAIAAEIGVTRQTVALWLREFGIRRDSAA